MKTSAGWLFLGLLAMAAHAQDARMPPPPPQEVTLEMYGPPDPPALDRGCTEGKVRDCVNLAILYERGEPGDLVEANFEQTQRLWKRVAELGKTACDAGDAKACGELGVSYRLGRGVPKDMARAAGLLDTACRGGEAMSCFLLGQQFERGQGVSKDAQRAVELYGRACQGKFQPACAAALKVSQ